MCPCHFCDKRKFVHARPQLFCRLRIISLVVFYCSQSASVLVGVHTVQATTLTTNAFEAFFDHTRTIVGECADLHSTLDHVLDCGCFHKRTFSIKHLNQAQDFITSRCTGCRHVSNGPIIVDKYTLQVSVVSVRRGRVHSRVPSYTYIYVYI